jgi:hypothetical protein
MRSLFQRSFRQLFSLRRAALARAPGGLGAFFLAAACALIVLWNVEAWLVGRGAISIYAAPVAIVALALAYALRPRRANGADYDNPVLDAQIIPARRNRR